MIKLLTLASMLAISLSHCHCQELAKGPAFEVVSITPCKPGTPEPPGEHAGMAQFTSPGGRFNARATTLKFLLEWAYEILPSQHSDGPAWIESDRYDILAKVGRNASDHEMKLMTRAMLAQRFKLKFHRESREQPVYVVSVGKVAPKLVSAKEDEMHSLRVVPQMGPDQKVASFHVVATHFTMAQLAEVFARQLGRVILDQTGLNGEFNFTLDLTPDENRPNPLDPSLLVDAMKQQLGLILKTQHAPVDYLIIDNAERVAAGN